MSEEQCITLDEQKCSGVVRLPDAWLTIAYSSEKPQSSALSSGNKSIDYYVQSSSPPQGLMEILRKLPEISSSELQENFLTDLKIPDDLRKRFVCEWQDLTLDFMGIKLEDGTPVWKVVVRNAIKRVDDLCIRRQLEGFLYPKPILFDDKPLEIARRTLAVLEAQVAAYTALTIPAHLQIELEEQRSKVADLEARIAS